MILDVETYCCDRANSHCFVMVVLSRKFFIFLPGQHSADRKRRASGISRTLGQLLATQKGDIFLARCVFYSSRVSLHTGK